MPMSPALMLNDVGHRRLGGGYMVNEGSRTRRKDQARDEMTKASEEGRELVTSRGSAYA